MDRYSSRFLSAWFCGTAAAAAGALISAATVLFAFRHGVAVDVSLGPLALRAGAAVLAAGTALAALAALAAAVSKRDEVAGSWVAGFVTLALVTRGASGLVPVWVVALAAIGSAAMAAATLSPLTRWATRRGKPAAAISLVALLAGAALPGMLKPRPSDPAPARAEGGAASSPSPTAPASLQRPQNVLLIVIDTLRADHLSSYGYARATSPQIDRLTAQGVRFAQASAQYTSTSPSMATLLTGTYPTTHNMVSVRTLLPMPLTTLAEALGASGYNTAAVVSNPNLARAFQFDQGFAHYDEAYSIGTKQHGDAITDRALTWLRAKGQAPFFLYVHYIDPHARYDPPAAFRDRFFGDSFSARHAALRLTLRRHGRGQISEDVVIDNGATDADRYVARYDEEISAVDHEVGRLLDALDREDLSDKTLVVLTADHGESLVEHDDYFNHGDFTYETGARVPLVMRFPGVVPAGRVVESPVELVDVFPTVVQSVGAGTATASDGASLWPLIIDSAGEWAPKPARVEAGHAAGRASCSWRDGDWKLIENQAALSSAEVARWSFLLSPKRWKRLWLASTGIHPSYVRWELYDLARDPNETLNLAVSRRDIFERLAPPLLAWRATFAAQRQLETNPPSLDPETKELLKSLGYVH